jgi:hypothetical protein
MFIVGSSFERFVFRHNTVLFTPDDIWQSHFGRTMGEADMLTNPASSAYYVQVWGNPASNEFYNNIMASASNGLTRDEGIVESNLFFTSGDDVPYKSINGSLSDYLNAGNLPGVLEAGSTAIDAGTDQYEIYETDIFGTLRDTTPDIGAVEYQ